MVIKLGAAALLIAFCLIVPNAQAQDGGQERDSIPQALRQPQRGEAPRYPRDGVIGELGRGAAPGEAYVFARLFLSALLSGSREAPVLLQADQGLVDRLFEELGPVEPRQLRLGGGREEDDGSVSFLVRFLGREKGKTGELYLLQKEETWRIDDLLLEEEQDLTEEKEAYRFDFSPYERFY
jgi:hypothetical protein